MSIPWRCSRVGRVTINDVSQSGSVQFGDSGTTSLRSRTIAIQRETPYFEGDETRFAAYALFFKPKLKLLPDTSVSFRSIGTEEEICVGAIRTLGVSNASFLRIGNGGAHEAISRVLNIRQYAANRDIR